MLRTNRMSSVKMKGINYGDKYDSIININRDDVTLISSKGSIDLLQNSIFNEGNIPSTTMNKSHVSFNTSKQTNNKETIKTQANNKLTNLTSEVQNLEDK